MVRAASVWQLHWHWSVGVLVLMSILTPHGSANSTASWTAKRSAMRHAMWGDPALTNRSHPDHIIDVVNASAGAPASAGVQKVVWNVSSGYFPLSSTTYYVPRQKGKRTNALMIHHHGHAQGCDNLDGSGKEIGCPRFWDFVSLYDSHAFVELSVWRWLHSTTLVSQWTKPYNLHSS